jgi:hypothetical protein
MCPFQTRIVAIPHIEKQILEARQREEVEIKSSNHYFSELVDLRNEFQMILSDIFKSANS